ncbi:MAG: hypothetical protein ICV83_35695, partial [Cytophagales bacterium]|nr:hypothetical protein [Cytophagales bacterium]
HQPSRTKTFRSLAGCLAFAGVAGWLLATEGTGSVMSWLGLVFFGGLAVFYLFELLRPKARPILPGSPEARAHRRTAEGPYQYFPGGFTIETYSRSEDVTFTHRVLWKEIEEVKLLRIRYPGRVVEGLRIQYGNVALETNESHESYYVLAERLKANLPGMPRDWQLHNPTGSSQRTEKTLWCNTPSAP